MTQLAFSKDGKIACGSCFTGCQRSCIPGTINLLKDGSKTGVVSPDHVAFSSFGVARSARKGAGVSYSAGEHVALAYNDTAAFFSAVVVRCDTWAVQWGVEKSACLKDARISHLSNLCANTICGVATAKGGVSQPEEQCVFVATRLDVPATSRKENKEWRHFLAAPRAVQTGVESEGIACVAAYGKNSFMVLTLSGSLALVSLDIGVLRAQEKTDTPFFSVALVSSKLRGIDVNPRISVHADGDKSVSAAVYSPGGSTVQLVQLACDAISVESSAGTAAVTEVMSDVPTDVVAFAGAFHLCVCSDRPGKNMQFFGLVPGATAVETMKFEPLTASHFPLAVFYNAATEHVVLLSTKLDSSAFAARSDTQKLSSLIEASVDFSSGPFGQDLLESASWMSVANPYHHHGPLVGHFTRQGRSFEEGEDAQVIKGLATNTAGRWTPLTLCYALSSTTGSRNKHVAVFSVETAPFLHTRLIKQWHNATAGLREILGTASTFDYNAVARPWNPRHVRRALRLLGQGELSSLLHWIAAALSASERVSSSVTYYNATTAAVELALHVVSLARQMGAVLHPEDVKAVAVMLRACRECGHELLRYASRMELLMESSLQQRAMNRVLRRRAASPQNGDDVAAQYLKSNFYGISAELQTERTLHTRYTSNTWAQHLATHESRYKGTAVGALRFLKLAKQGSDDAGDRALSDWRRLGSTAHPDPVLNEFEQTLL